jgi:superkiller protein 3
MPHTNDHSSPSRVSAEAAEVDEHIKHGDEFRSQGQLDKAIEEFKAAETKMGAIEKRITAELESKKGAVLLVKKDFPGAIAALTKAIECNSDDPKVLTELKEAWQEALRMDPKAPENHIGMGQVYEISGEFDLAEAEYKKGLSLAQSDTKIKEAGEKLLGSIPAAKSNRTAKEHINAGVNLHEKGLFDQAVEEYKNALNCGAIENQLASLAWLNMGAAYQKKKSYDEALSAYRKALSFDPQNPSAKLGLESVEQENRNRAAEIGQIAASLFKKEKYDESIEQYKAALKLAPEEAALHFNLGVAYQWKKDLDAAIEEYRQASSLNPTSEDYTKALEQASAKKADLFIQLAEEKQKAKDYASAITLYKQAIPFLPNLGALWHNLADAYFSSGQFDKAREAFQTAVKLDPKGMSDDLYAIGSIDEHLGQGAEALAAYKQYLEQSPKGNFASAIETRIKALTANIQNTIKIPSEEHP